MNDDVKKLEAVTIEPLKRPVGFSLAVPGSKSIANRAILLAGFAEGRSFLREAPQSDDIDAALSALAALGVSLSSPEPGCWEIDGHGVNLPVREADVHIGSSGTVARFLPGLLAAVPSGRWRLTASEQLAARPLAPLLRALSGWGAETEREDSAANFPLRVAGGTLSGGRTEVSAAASSQFASGLLLAGPLCPAGAELRILDLDPGERYVDMTLDVMRRFGAAPKILGGETIAFAPQSYRATEMTIEADCNSANYFLALPLLVGGSVAVVNWAAGSGQPGRKFLSVLERLGGEVEETADCVRVAGSGLPLRGGFDIDMRAMSEMAPTLGVMAAFADWPVTMRNLAHIRGHETDRLAAMRTLLRRVGVECEAGSDWLRVHPCRKGLKRAVIDSLDDHRLVMSFTLLGLAGEGLTIANPGAVAKTFPDFFRRLALGGADIVPV